MKRPNTHYFRMALVLGSMCLGVLHAQSVTYTTFPVPEAAPATAGSLSVSGINKPGVIVGYLTDTSGNLEGFMRDTAGNITLLVDPLDTSTPTATTAYGINDAGEIRAKGYFYDTAAGLYYGYFSKGGNYVTVNLPNQPAGTDASVNSVNNNKDFCGFVLAPPYTTYKAFVSIKGKVTVFGVNGSSDTQCFAINSADEAVGAYTDSGGVSHGWMRNPSTGALTRIDVPGATTVPGSVPCTGNNLAGTVAYGINDQGYLSGHYYDKSYNVHGFARTPAGKFIPLNAPGAFETGGGGLNNDGVVVGHWSDSSCTNYGYTATLP